MAEIIYPSSAVRGAGPGGARTAGRGSTSAAILCYRLECMLVMIKCTFKRSGHRAGHISETESVHMNFSYDE